MLCGVPSAGYWTILVGTSLTLTMADDREIWMLERTMLAFKTRLSSLRSVDGAVVKEERE